MDPVAEGLKVPRDVLKRDTCSSIVLIFNFLSICVMAFTIQY